MSNNPFGIGDEGRKNAITAAIIVFAFAALILLGKSPQLAVALGFAATGLTAVLALPERKRNGNPETDSTVMDRERREPPRDVEVRPPSSDPRSVLAVRHLGWLRRLDHAEPA